MNFVKPAAVALALAVTSAAFVPVAEARSNHYYGHGNYHGHHHNGGFNTFGAGVAGFAAGALLGSLAQPNYYGNGYYNNGYYSNGYYGRGYYAEPSYSYAPAPVYVAPPRAYYRQQPAYDPCESTGVSRPATSMC